MKFGSSDSSHFFSDVDAFGVPCHSNELESITRTCSVNPALESFRVAYSSRRKRKAPISFCGFILVQSERGEVKCNARTHAKLDVGLPACMQTRRWKLQTAQRDACLPFRPVRELPSGIKARLKENMIRAIN